MKKANKVEKCIGCGKPLYYPSPFGDFQVREEGVREGMCRSCRRKRDRAVFRRANDGRRR